MSYNIYSAPPAEHTIFVYNKDLIRLGEIASFSSLSMERSLTGVGSFSLEVPAVVDARLEGGIAELKVDNIISLGGSDSRVGIIDTVTVSGDKTASLVVKGQMLKGIATWRQIDTPVKSEEYPDADGWEKVIAPCEGALRHYVNTQCINPHNPDRKIDRVVLEPAEDPLRGEEIRWYASQDKTLAAVLESIGNVYGFGWDIRLDIAQKCFVYVTIPPRDRTIGSGNAVVFSYGNDNLVSFQYTSTRKSRANALYIGGAGEYEDRLILTAHLDETGAEVSTPYVGWERREGWIAAGNLADPEELMFEGKHKYLSKCKPSKGGGAEISNSMPFEYGKHWDLGDRVTLLLEPYGAGIRWDAQITKVTESYTRGGVRVTPTFGQEVPSITKKMGVVE